MLILCFFAGGFRGALSLYTDAGFLVTSLDADKNPVMSLEAKDIGRRARPRLFESLLLLRVAAGGNVGRQNAEGNGAGEGGNGVIDGDSDGDGRGDGYDGGNGGAGGNQGGSGGGDNSVAGE